MYLDLHISLDTHINIFIYIGQHNLTINLPKVIYINVDMNIYIYMFTYIYICICICVDTYNVNIYQDII
jgi:hypothetical protein